METISLRSVKLTDGAVTIAYQKAVEDENGYNETENTLTDTRIPVREFSDIFDTDLPGILAEIAGKDDPEGLLINEVRLSGKDDNAAILCKGVLASPFGNIKLTFPRIKYLVLDNEICTALTVLIPHLESCVSDYINGKDADLEEL